MGSPEARRGEGEEPDGTVVVVTVGAEDAAGRREAGDEGGSSIGGAAKSVDVTVEWVPGSMRFMRATTLAAWVAESSALR